MTLRSSTWPLQMIRFKTERLQRMTPPPVPTCAKLIRVEACLEKDNWEKKLLEQGIQASI